MKILFLCAKITAIHNRHYDNIFICFTTVAYSEVLIYKGPCDINYYIVCRNLNLINDFLFLINFRFDITAKPQLLRLP